MTCENLIAGCFAGDRAPFASHQADAERAAHYLECCVKAQVPWSVVERQIRDYLATKGASATFVTDQVRRAQRLMLPWLEREDDESATVVDLRP